MEFLFGFSNKSVKIICSQSNTSQKVTRDPVFMKLTFFFLLTGKLPTPEIDLGFAIAAGSLYADETFQLMKDTIEEGHHGIWN